VNHLDNGRIKSNEMPFITLYAYVKLNMFRSTLCSSSEAHDDSFGYHIGHLVLVVFYSSADILSCYLYCLAINLGRMLLND